MSRKAPLGFAFVIADDLGKPNAKDRKLIRSHCMRGKNVKPESRRRSARKKVADGNGRDGPTVVPAGENSEDYLSLTPPAPPLDAFPVLFASRMDHSSRALLYKCPAPPQLAPLLLSLPLLLLSNMATSLRAK